MARKQNPDWMDTPVVDMITPRQRRFFGRVLGSVVVGLATGVATLVYHTVIDTLAARRIRNRR